MRPLYWEIFSFGPAGRPSDRHLAVRRIRAWHGLRRRKWAQILILALAFSTAACAQQRVEANADLPEAPHSQMAPASALPAEARNASIHGTVKDRDGAVYQGVAISLTGPVSPVSTQTDADGRFLFENLPAGLFKLTVSAQGFATQTLSVQLHASESLEVPAITLLVSTATTDVQVNASQQDIAQAQLKEEEQQRVFGAIPNFYVVYASDPAPLTSRQKFHLAWRSSIDPVTFLATGLFAGIEQAANTFPGYGQGAQGYAKRFGANYADNVIGTMIGSAILPSLLKQDPRYFYKGTGTVRERIRYALRSAVLCKGDNGRWQVNYSGILGGAAAGGVSNLYYPASDRNGIGLTLENTALGIAGTAVQNLFQEFLVRKLTPNLPKNNPQQP
jgi:hypothetical protein